MRGHLLALLVTHFPASECLSLVFLQRQLSKNIKFGRPPPSAIPMKKADSGEAGLEEDLLLSSPMEIVTHEDVPFSDTESKVRLLRGVTWLLLSEGRTLGSGQGIQRLWALRSRECVTEAFLLSGPGLEGTLWSAARHTSGGQLGAAKGRRALHGRSSKRLPLTLQDSAGPTFSRKPWLALPSLEAVSPVSLLGILHASHTPILIRVHVIVLSPSLNGEFLEDRLESPHLCCPRTQLVLT